VARDLILTATILAIIFLAAHRNPPSRMVEVPYCVVDQRYAVKDRSGKWHFGYTDAYGPCHLQDRFVDA
jgi:hypothetical protein